MSTTSTACLVVFERNWFSKEVGGTVAARATRYTGILQLKLEPVPDRKQQSAAKSKDVVLKSKDCVIRVIKLL